MATCRRFLNLAKDKRTSLYRPQKYYSTNVQVKADSNKNNEIIVPYRIHRGPTDILKALASTISKDHTAPQYKYEDDPYLIPSNNVTKRAFALSKESGRKAARYFLEKYPELFLCNKSVPHIKAFDPPTVYTSENVTSPDALVECIKNFQVKNSINVYKILKEKGFTVSQEIKQDLLELLCFYNGSEPPEEDYYEERYFHRSQKAEKWNARGEAERLFDEMKKDGKAYSAIIAGAAKFQDAERAFQLFEEMQNKGIVPTVEAFNGVISGIPFIKERRDTGCEYALFLLESMKKSGLMPNLYTMNAVLDVFVKRRFRKVNELSLAILAEMKKLNIEPSLGTYNLILTLFCDESAGKIGVLYEIIDNIEGKEFTARHPLDVTFFTSAMEKCYKIAHDKDLACRINKIVEFRNNCKLLGSAITESIYFKNFLKLLCETEDFEKFMEIYDQYVPNTYTPEPSLMADVLQALQLSGHYKYLPKLCNDVYVFEQSERETIISTIMETAGCMKHEKKIQNELVEIIWKITSKINARLESRRFNFYWTGEVLGNALNTFINGKDMEKSWSVMKQFLDDDGSSIIGPPPKKTLLSFCELFLENRDYGKVEICIKYAMKEVYPEFVTDFKTLSEDMIQKEKIEAKHRIHVNNILQAVSYHVSSDASDFVKSSSSKTASKDSVEDSTSNESNLSDSSSSDSDLSDSSSSDSDLSDSSSSDDEDGK